MSKLNREQELWNLIRYEKDATSEQIKVWCQELAGLREVRGTTILLFPESSSCNEEIANPVDL